MSDQEKKVYNIDTYSLIVAGNLLWVKHWLLLHSVGSCFEMQVQKGLVVTNTLAYYTKAYITIAKVSQFRPTGANFIKLFTAVSYAFP
jgi:hypothetical protein